MGGKSSKARSGSTSHVQTGRTPPREGPVKSSHVGVSRQPPAAAPVHSKPPSPLEQFLGNNGVYPGKPNFPASTIRQRVLEGSLAPRWPPLAEDCAPEGVVATECPVCFHEYAGPINSTSCCSQPLCSECFLFVQTPACNKPCPYCTRDAFKVACSEDCSKHCAGVLRAQAAAKSKAAVAPAATGASSAAASPEPVATASVAQRQQLEAMVAAQTADMLSAQLEAAKRDRSASLSAERSPPQSRRWGGGEGGLRHAARSTPRRRHNARGEDLGPAAGRGRGRRWGAGPAPSTPSPGPSEADLDLMERLMLLQAMRASLEDAGESAPSQQSAHELHSGLLSLLQHARELASGAQDSPHTGLHSGPHTPAVAAAAGGGGGSPSITPQAPQESAHGAPRRRSSREGSPFDLLHFNSDSD